MQWQGSAVFAQTIIVHRHSQHASARPKKRRLISSYKRGAFLGPHAFLRSPAFGHFFARQEKHVSPLLLASFMFGQIAKYTSSHLRELGLKRNILLAPEAHAKLH